MKLVLIVAIGIIVLLLSNPFKHNDISSGQVAAPEVTIDAKPTEATPTLFGRPPPHFGIPQKHVRVPEKRAHKMVPEPVKPKPKPKPKPVAPATAPPSAPEPEPSPEPEQSQARVAPSGEQSVAAFKSWAASRVGGEQFSCLEPLWEAESGWNHYAQNSSSGAYGIPQALPGEKMASAGSDWSSNGYTQMEWGLGYISERYGSPCGAWSAFQSQGWY